MGTMEYEQICALATSAVDCLRILAAHPSGHKQIGYFPGYLPSTLNYLENRYGAMEIQTILLSPVGSVHYRLELK
jgi:hypothetical protein